MASKRIRRKSKPQSFRRSRYWMAVGALAAYSATVGNPLLRAQTTVPDPTTKTGTSVQGLPARRYQIAAGPLRQVLARFEEVSLTRIQLPNEEVLDLPSPGVNGLYTTEEALRLLLTGTTLQYRFTNAHQIALRLAATASTVDVTDVAPTMQSSMPKFQAPLVDLPQTVNVVTQQTMQQQGSTTLRDALRNVAGISLAAGEGGSQGDNLTIRGFTARNDLFIDGMRDFGSYYRDPFNTSEIQVLQGPSSVTFGRGSTGGVVNQSSKTPELNTFVSGNVQFGTDTTRRATLDISRALPSLGHGASFRMNLMGNIGNVAGRDTTANRRLGFAPSLAFGLGTATRVNLSVLHQNEDNTPDYGLPWYFNQPAPVNRNNYYGMDGNYLRTNVNIGTAKVEHDVNPHVVLRDQVRYANYQRDLVITEPLLRNIGLSTPLNTVNITRNEISAKSTETMLDNQTDGIAHFNTGKIRHTLVTGFEAFRETSDPTRFAYVAPGTSLLSPSSNQQFAAPPTTTSHVNDSANDVSAYVLDSASFGKHVIASGGVRYDRFDNTYAQTVGTPSQFNRVDAKPTWRAALVYKPTANGSVYVDAGTSFNPSAESLSLSAGTANVPPENNKTYEAGSKWDFNRGRLQLNGSVFQTTKENARETDPANSLLVVVSGTQRVNGVQTAITGHISNRWDIMSSYANLDSKVVASRFYPLSVGYPLANVPRNNFTFWSNHRLPQHFELGLGANFLGKRTVSSTVPIEPVTGQVKAVPSYWVFNAMLSHPINEHVEMQLNGYNLANRYYYDQLHPNHVIPGPGRSLLVGFRFHF